MDEAEAAVRKAEAELRAKKALLMRTCVTCNTVFPSESALRSHVGDHRP